MFLQPCSNLAKISTRELTRTNVLTKFHEDWTKNLTSRVLTRFYCPAPWLPYIIRINALTNLHEIWTKHVTSRQQIRNKALPLCGHVIQQTKTISEPRYHKTNLLTKVHEDWNINYSQIWKKATSLGHHVFQSTEIIFELVQYRYIIGTNLLTQFHEDQTINVASRALTRQMLTPPDRRMPDKSRSQKLTTNIIGTYLLTKFHEDRKINVASRVLTRKNALPPGSHVFQPTGIIIELIQNIIGINLLTNFQEDRTVNVASRPYKKNALPLGSHFFQANIIIFELIQNIIETNLLTKFPEDWTINVASRENCPAPHGHLFKATKTIFELIQDISGTNLLTKFHDDRKINVTSRVLTRKIAPPLWWPYRTINVASRVKNAPPLGGHVIQANVIIFKLIQYIIKTNLLTIFHQAWTINVASTVLTRKNAPPPWRPCFSTNRHHFRTHWTINVASRVKNAPPLGSHVFQAKITISELIKDISGTNLLSKFHEDRKINVASKVLTRKNAPPPGGHVFQPTGIIFELIQDIIGINLLTMFHEDQTINVASRVKNAPPLGSHVNIDVAQRTTDDGQKAITKAHHEHLVLR
ncbi:hypothetical protein DPMN_115650 [Dreissena polymorpha]|uniref:Uncharacterized protein n=1 Tax=Dreissena polymorpha TaxID=45954 RepID=A0A9D4KN78_DREPO|nr:hypothetical protein DPMN_115650 [Dreissena polymorpha]